MTQPNISKQIFDSVGGKDNIKSCTHCVTRLRLVLNDDSLFNQEQAEKINGVLGVVQSSGQHQFVLGPKVEQVYQDVIKQLPNGGQVAPASTEKKPLTIRNMFSSALDILIACFIPSISAIAGSGMIKVLCVLLSTFGILSADSATYVILNGIGDAIFVFLPFFVAFNAAKKLNTDVQLSMVLAAILFYPNIQALAELETDITFLGFGVQILDYSSQAIPMIFGVWLLKYADKLADKLSPSIVKVFLRPMIALLTTAPILLFIIGPASLVLGNLFASFCELMNTWGWLAVGLNAALFPILVLTGTHNATIPLLVQMFATQGFDSIFLVGGLAANLAQAGAAAGVALKSRNKEMKSNAASAALSASLGITEPAMYGVNLPLKKPFAHMLIGALVSGCLMGLAKLTIPTFVTPSLLTASIFFNPQTNVFLGLISIAAAVAIPLILTCVLGFKENDQSSTENSSAPRPATDSTPSLSARNDLIVPLSGKIIPLEEMNDETFAKKLLGDGYAIVPADGKLISPVTGTIATLFPTHHAIGLVGDDGTEILIHIGIDTVTLNGKGFVPAIKEGDHVKVGDPLMTFDLEMIRQENLDPTTAVLFTNGKTVNVQTGINHKAGEKGGAYA